MTDVDYDMPNNMKPSVAVIEKLTCSRGALGA